MKPVTCEGPVLIFGDLVSFSLRPHFHKAKFSWPTSSLQKDPMNAAKAQALKLKLGQQLTTFPLASQMGPLHSTDFLALPCTSLPPSDALTLSPSSATTSMLPKRSKLDFRPPLFSSFEPRQTAFHCHPVCHSQPRNDSPRLLPYLPPCLRIFCSHSPHRNRSRVPRSSMLTLLSPWMASRARRRLSWASKMHRRP